MNRQEVKKLEKQVLEKLREYIKEGDIVIAAVSGGPDSVFLLQFLKHTKAKIIVAHLNHKLRKESDSEEEFVRKISAPLIFHGKSLDIKKLSRTSKKGLEETGRKARYDFFNDLAKKYKAKYIVTAHHADDNLETIILNFARGAGLQGLSGMRESDKQRLRPLLNIPKKQIINFLKAEKIAFKTDKSNKDTLFKRNFIRHKIIPQLQKINPSLTETIGKNAGELRKINEHLIQQAETWLNKNAKDNQLNAKSFRRQHESLQKFILLESYKKLIGNTINIENTHLNEILEMINKNVGAKKKKLGKLTVELRNNIIYYG